MVRFKPPADLPAMPGLLMRSAPGTRVRPGRIEPAGAAERGVAAADAAAVVIFQEEIFRVCPNISATYQSSCIPR